jgi:hypothetical protein
MKTLNIALVAATLLVGAVPAIAADATSYKDQMTSLWIATGDANYARAAGLNDQQINAVQHQAREGVSLESATSNAN